MDALIIFQGQALVFIICVFISILTGVSILTAVSILTVVYPKVVLTVVFILRVVYILSGSSLSNSSQQHSPHFYFHVIFISAYSAVVRVKIYAYVNILGRNDLINYITVFQKGKRSLQACNFAGTRITDLVKGSMR